MSIVLSEGGSSGGRGDGLVLYENVPKISSFFNPHPTTLHYSVQKFKK